MVLLIAARGAGRTCYTRLVMKITHKSNNFRCHNSIPQRLAAYFSILLNTLLYGDIWTVDIVIETSKNEIGIVYEKSRKFTNTLIGIMKLLYVTRC